MTHVDSQTADTPPPVLMMTPAVKVWYDGACPLCMREIAFMQRLDTRGCIEFVDATLPDTECPLDRQLMLSRFHADEDGVLLSGAAAFAAMWRALPVLRVAGIMARNRHVLAVLEKLYVVFLRWRPFLQQWATRSTSR